MTTQSYKYNMIEKQLAFLKEKENNLDIQIRQLHNIEYTRQRIKEKRRELTRLKLKQALRFW